MSSEQPRTKRESRTIEAMIHIYCRDHHKNGRDLCTECGELLDYERAALRYTDNQDVKEYRINLAVRLALWNVKANKLEWEEGSFVGDTTYFISGATAKTEKTAIDDAIKDLAKRIVERAVEDW